VDEGLSEAAPVSVPRITNNMAVVDDEEAVDAASEAIATIQRASKKLQRPVDKKRALKIQQDLRLAEAVSRGAVGI
jgi:hypothetical protein